MCYAIFAILLYAIVADTDANMLIIKIINNKNNHCACQLTCCVVSLINQGRSTTSLSLNLCSWKKRVYEAFAEYLKHSISQLP